ncbi:MAG: HNH endonuclease [Planctomycetia bacterium]|nr:HNH endonuclease [Planctomycetia bacterium]
MALSRRRLVYERANGRCEYCQSPALRDILPFQLDHIRSRKHGGPTKLSNLALSCLACNTFKGSDIAAIDPETDTLQPLFDPRRDVWNVHFRWDGPILVGNTAIGRATAALLRINLPTRVDYRRSLMRARLF